MTTQAEHEAHNCLVGFADCGCLWGVTVLGHGRDDAAYRDASDWVIKGARVQQMTVAAFRGVSVHCPLHPDGRWDERGRDKPATVAAIPNLGL